MAAVKSIKLDDDLKNRVESLADAKRRSAHWIMREAIAEYVEREEQRETLRRDILKAWEEYRDTGLHVPAADVDTWLESWGTENEKPAPACRR
ncbi:ribbon-helix-helix protein, CopG family [Acetobacter musti]|uniref:Ribbon-helix-helix protein, CopG family n=1 Tax=Acetobacter musti TaxID=864732 RepID=A0ABX0JT95_9PROT|nr:ribbon-helix-helix protein, CopG family [Acetobacter musti]